MHAHEFLTSAAIIFAIMGLVALIELAVPLFTQTSAPRGRRAANLGMTILVIASTWAATATASLIALALSLGAPGPMARLGVPVAAQILVGVVLLDFSFGYLAHWAMHVSPTLWRVHRVHHSDPFVDVTTSYRTHPLEGGWRFLFVIVPVWIHGLPAEAVVIHRLLSALNGILEHANIRLWPPLERLLSLFWVTPNMHKVHHSRDAAETDSNYGNILSIHDRLLRTFTPTNRAFAVAYGLDDADPLCVASLRRLLTMPFHAAAPGLRKPHARSDGLRQEQSA